MEMKGNQIENDIILMEIKLKKIMKDNEKVISKSQNSKNQTIHELNKWMNSLILVIDIHLGPVQKVQNNADRDENTHE
jgi:hypothetical protein